MTNQETEPYSDHENRHTTCEGKNKLYIYTAKIYPQGVCDVFQSIYESPSQRVAYTWL